MPETQQDVLSAESLRKTYHQRGGRGAGTSHIQALRDVSLRVAEAECLGIAGESGSGKSTLARILVGLEAPTSGTVQVAGQTLATKRTATERRHHARRIQMVFQDPYSSLDPHQAVGDVLDEVQRVHFDRNRTTRSARTVELLDAVGLASRYIDALPRTLSGGQRQRLAIARALAAEPSILLLDEAVSALDVSIQAQILNLLSDLRDALSLTYVFISHDLAVVHQVADRVMVLYQGELMEEGRIDPVFRSPSHPYTTLLLDSVPRPGMVLTRRPERVHKTDETGCLFRDRCPHAFERCVEHPPLFDAPAGSRSRCWLVDPAVQSRSSKE